MGEEFDAAAAPPSINVVAPTQYDLTQKVTTSPLYTLYKVYPENGTVPLAITTTSTHNVEFHIPSHQLVNLSRSIVRFKIANTITAATGTTTTGDAGLIVESTVLPFSAVRLFTRSGTNLVNVNFLQDYAKICMIPSASQARLENEDAGFVANADGKEHENPPLNILGVGRSVNNGGSPGGPLPETKYDGAGLIVAQATNTAESVQITVAHSLALNVQAGHNHPLYTIYELRLSDLIGTLFSYDKSIMFSETLVLQLQVAPSEMIHIGKSSVNSLNMVGAAIIAATGGGPSQLINGTLTYSDMHLQLTQDENKSAILSWNSRLASGAGFDATIPYTTMMKFSHSAAVSGSNTLRLNRGHGSSLLRIITGVRRAVEAKFLSYDYSNTRGADKVAQYQTLLNARPLQPKVLVCTENEDWLYNRNYLADGVCGDFFKYRTYASIHIDQFGSDADTLSGAPVSDFYKSGLPLDQEVIYTRNDVMKAAVAHVQMFCIIAQKSMRISAEGVSVL